MRECGFPPVQIDRMTLPEIAVALDDGKPRPLGRPQMSKDQQADHRKRWREMTPLERLDADI